MRKKLLTKADVVERHLFIEACKDLDAWEYGARLMERTDDPLLKEKIAVILSGKSVSH